MIGDRGCCLSITAIIIAMITVRLIIVITATTTVTAGTAITGILTFLLLPLSLLPSLLGIAVVC